MNVDFELVGHVSVLWDISLADSLTYMFTVSTKVSDPNASYDNIRSKRPGANLPCEGCAIYFIYLAYCE